VRARRDGSVVRYSAKEFALWIVSLIAITVFQESQFSSGVSVPVRYYSHVKMSSQLDLSKLPVPVAGEIVVTKSASDKRHYRALILENKLKVMLISDQTTDKAAGSLTVGAGTYASFVELCVDGRGGVIVTYS